MSFLRCINLLFLLIALNSVFGEFYFTGRTWDEIDQLPENMKCGRVKRNLPKDWIEYEGIHAVYKGEYPWMAKVIRVEERGWGETMLKFICTGTLISRKHVLTAASCLYGYTINHVELGTRPLTLGLKIGILKRLHETNTLFDYSIEEQFPNDEYPPKYDIGLITLDRKVRILEDVSPICLPRIDVRHGSLNYTIASWSFGGDMTTTRIGYYVIDLKTRLRKSEVTALGRDDCRGFFYSTVEHDRNDRNLLCAKKPVKEYNELACKIETGAPLMRIDEFEGKEYFFLYGVATKVGDVKFCTNTRLFAYVYDFLGDIICTIDNGPRSHRYWPCLSPKFDEKYTDSEWNEP